jgi:serine protease inhibitor ecotin
LQVGSNSCCCILYQNQFKRITTRPQTEKGLKREIKEKDGKQEEKNKKINRETQKITLIAGVYTK